MPKPSCRSRREQLAAVDQALQPYEGAVDSMARAVTTLIMHCGCVP